MRAAAGFSDVDWKSWWGSRGVPRLGVSMVPCGMVGFWGCREEWGGGLARAGKRGTPNLAASVGQDGGVWGPAPTPDRCGCSLYLCCRQFWGGPHVGRAFGGFTGPCCSFIFGRGGALGVPPAAAGESESSRGTCGRQRVAGPGPGVQLGGPPPQTPASPPPPSPGGIGAQGPLNPYLQLGFPVLPQFPHLQNGVSDTEPPLKTFRGSSKALYHWGDSGDMGGGGRRVNAVGEALGTPVRS